MVVSPKRNCPVTESKCFNTFGLYKPSLYQLNMNDKSLTWNSLCARLLPFIVWLFQCKSLTVAPEMLKLKVYDFYSFNFESRWFQAFIVSLFNLASLWVTLLKRLPLLKGAYEKFFFMSKPSKTSSLDRFQMNIRLKQLTTCFPI